MRLTLRASRAHLISLFTEGSPHDLGQDFREGAQKLFEVSQESFDVLSFESPRSLISQDPSWNKSFHNFVPEIESNVNFSKALKWNRGWAQTGLFAWKPRLILDYLRKPEVSPGDIVFYHDSNSVKYPEYLDGVHLWPRFLRSNLRLADVLLFRDNRARLISDTKPELWEQFFDADLAKNLKHVWGGAIAFKKSNRSQLFLERWNNLAQDPRNLLPFSRANSDKKFVIHAADQAILSCLWHESQQNRKTKRFVKCVYLNESRRIPPDLKKK